MRDEKKIALGARLKSCKNVMTLGVKPDFSDYSAEEALLIKQAEKIYYPGSFYADIFNARGKKIFPGYHTYIYAQDKIRQTALFHLLNIPHPRTKIFYGSRRTFIPDHFSFPFIGKIPKGSAMGRGVFLIRNFSELSAYCRISRTAYIQEYLHLSEDIRVVVIGEKPVLAYRRIAKPGEFRTNVAAGAKICFDAVPQPAIDLAVRTARQCGWDDTGIDICQHEGRFYVLEANMKYGREGFRKAGIDYIRLMETMIENRDI